MASIISRLYHRIKGVRSGYRDFESKKKEFETLLKGGNPRKFNTVFNRHLLIDESTSETNYDRHYVLHLAWATRVLLEINPEVHTDISSSLHFCTMLSAFLPVKFFDYRPAEIKLSNLSSDHVDLTDLNFEDNSIESLSCMHVVEHIGLGRYGDPIDYNGDLAAMKELSRVLKPGGKLLFVTPVGKPSIVFNRHRVYSYDQIKEAFASLELEEFTLIPEDGKDGDLVKDPELELVNNQTYGCGCWIFKKN